MGNKFRRGEVECSGLFMYFYKWQKLDADVGQPSIREEYTLRKNDAQRHIGPLLNHHACFFHIFANVS